jgi:hypothetical protein
MYIYLFNESNTYGKKGNHLEALDKYVVQRFNRDLKL